MKVRLSAFLGLLESRVMDYPDETPEEFSLTLPLRRRKDDEEGTWEFLCAKITFRCAGSTGTVGGAIYEYILCNIDYVRKGVDI